MRVCVHSDDAVGQTGFLVVFSYRAKQSILSFHVYRVQSMFEMDYFH